MKLSILRALLNYLSNLFATTAFDSAIAVAIMQFQRIARIASGGKAVVRWGMCYVSVV